MLWRKPLSMKEMGCGDPRMTFALRNASNFAKKKGAAPGGQPLMFCVS